MAPARPPASVTLRPPRLRDRDALVNLWTDLFAERPDYGGAGREHIRADAQKRVDALLDSSNEPPLDWACVALHDGAVVGALLPDMFGSYPQIDVLFVAPDWQRRGVGTALLRTFAQAVRADDAPCVVSTSHPANRASRGWHRAMGFCPLPSRPLIQHLRLCLQANLVHEPRPCESGSARQDYARPNRRPPPRVGAQTPYSCSPDSVGAGGRCTGAVPRRVKRVRRVFAVRCVNRKDTSLALPRCGCSRPVIVGCVQQLYVGCQLSQFAPRSTFSLRVLDRFPTPAWTLLRVPPAQSVPTVRPTGRPSAWPSSPGPTTTSRTASH